MKPYGGFEHNLQGLRVVDKLEKRYPDFDGLNLSWEVREGIAKHTTEYDKPKIPGFERGKPSTLEAQVVNVADEIAYDNHDLDDGLTSGLIAEEQLKGIALWEEAVATVEKISPGLDPRTRHYQVVRSLINLSVTDLVENSEKKISEIGPEKAGKTGQPIINFSPGMVKKRKPLKDFLYNQLYCHHRVIRMANKAKRFIEELFKVYQQDARQLPPEVQIQVETEGKERAICDFLAGMTDRYAQDEYKRLFEPYERV